MPSITVWYPDRRKFASRRRRILHQRQGWSALVTFHSPSNGCLPFAGYGSSRNWSWAHRLLQSEPQFDVYIFVDNVQVVDEFDPIDFTSGLDVYIFVDNIQVYPLNDKPRYGHIPKPENDVRNTFPTIYHLLGFFGESEVRDEVNIYRDAPLEILSAFKYLSLEPGERAIRSTWSLLFRALLLTFRTSTHGNLISRPSPTTAFLYVSRFCNCNNAIHSLYFNSKHSAESRRQVCSFVIWICLQLRLLFVSSSHAQWNHRLVAVLQKAMP